MFRKFKILFLLSDFIVLFFGFLLFNYLREIALASPPEEEWYFEDFPIEIRNWDNPLGTEGIDNSGINKVKCMYKVESFNPGTNQQEITHNPENKGCQSPITITIDTRTGDGWKEDVNTKIKTADCKYSGENACKVTAWAEDNAGNSNFGTGQMAIKYFNIDTTPPITKIKVFAPSGKEVTDIDWLHEKGIYTVQPIDEDLESGLDYCQFKIWDKTVGWIYWNKTRACNSNITFTVGPTGDCRTEGKKDTRPCRIWFVSYNKAGERSLDSTVTGKKNYISYDIDWTPPKVEIK